MSLIAALTRGRCLTVTLVWLAAGCGANCLRDSDCDDGLVCSRDRCVLEARRGTDAGPGSEGAAGSASEGAAGAGSGGSGGRPPLPGSSNGGSTGGRAAGGSSAMGGSATGGSATGGRENLDASVGTDAGSSPS